VALDRGGAIRVMRNRVVTLMQAERALTTAISYAQRAHVSDALLVRLLEVKRDVIAERAALEQVETMLVVV
jgi:hypothetical protein